MSLNTSRNAVIAARRQQIARLRLQGATLREIQAQLSVDGAPCALGTIHADLQVMEDDWRTAAAADIVEYKARQLAELAEIKRAAWADGKLMTVLAALRVEVEITGTKAHMDITSAGAPLQIILDR